MLSDSVERPTKTGSGVSIVVDWVVTSMATQRSISAGGGAGGFFEVRLAMPH